MHWHVESIDFQSITKATRNCFENVAFYHIYSPYDITTATILLNCIPIEQIDKS